MKKETRKQQYENYADVIKAIREHKPVKRSRAKDRSIATRPIVPVIEGVPEKYVVVKCIAWLRSRHIVCDRNNTGVGQIGSSGIYAYGIKNGGDIIGIMPDGRHLEVECKRSNGGRLSAGQQQRMKKVREHNGLYFVIHGNAELEYYLGQYL